MRTPPDARAHMQAGRCCVIENDTCAENVELDLLSVKATRIFDYLLQDPLLFAMKAERARTDAAGCVASRYFDYADEAESRFVLVVNERQEGRTTLQLLLLDDRPTANSASRSMCSCSLTMV